MTSRRYAHDLCAHTPRPPLTGPRSSPVILPPPLSLVSKPPDRRFRLERRAHWMAPTYPLPINRSSISVFYCRTNSSFSWIIQPLITTFNKISTPKKLLLFFSPFPPNFNFNFSFPHSWYYLRAPSVMVHHSSTMSGARLMMPSLFISDLM